MASNTRSRARRISSSNKSQGDKKCGDAGAVKSTEADDAKGGKDGAPEQERPESPENCSICLSGVENKSFTDSCLHTFCFICLQEWSKVKAVCPLCKQKFKRIIYNVRSLDDFDQYEIPPDLGPPDHLWENPGGRRFHYRTTMTNGRQTWMDNDAWLGTLRRRHPAGEGSRALSARGLSAPGVRVRTRSENSRRQQATTQRRHVYDNDLWVRTVSPTRYRETSPTFYAANPACRYALIPWLSRELNVLLHQHDDNVHFVLELVLDLVQRFEIRSADFYELIRPLIGVRSRHFIHEFYQFARSPYDMYGYDQRATYEQRGVANERRADMSDDDVVILSDSNEEPQTLSQMLSEQSGVSLANIAPINVEWNIATTAGDVRTFLQSVMENESGYTGWVSPEPASSSTISRINSHHNYSYLIAPRPVDGDGAAASANPPVVDMAASDGDDDVIFVKYEKPMAERSPITISSSSDDEIQDKVNSVSRGERVKNKTDRAAQSNSHRSSIRSFSGRMNSPYRATRRSMSRDRRPRSRDYASRSRSRDRTVRRSRSRDYAPGQSRSRDYPVRRSRSRDYQSRQSRSRDRSSLGSRSHDYSACRSRSPRDRTSRHSRAHDNYTSSSSAARRRKRERSHWTPESRDGDRQKRSDSPAETRDLEIQKRSSSGRFDPFKRTQHRDFHISRRRHNSSPGAVELVYANHKKSKKHSKHKKHKKHKRRRISISSESEIDVVTVVDMDEPSTSGVKRYKKHPTGHKSSKRDTINNDSSPARKLQSVVVIAKQPGAESAVTSGFESGDVSGDSVLDVTSTTPDGGHDVARTSDYRPGAELSDEMVSLFCDTFSRNTDACVNVDSSPKAKLNPVIAGVQSKSLNGNVQEDTVNRTMSEAVVTNKSHYVPEALCQTSPVQLPSIYDGFHIEAAKKSSDLIKAHSNKSRVETNGTRTLSLGVSSDTDSDSDVSIETKSDDVLFESESHDVAPAKRIWYSESSIYSDMSSCPDDYSDSSSLNTSPDRRRAWSTLHRPAVSPSLRPSNSERFPRQSPVVNDSDQWHVDVEGSDESIIDVGRLDTDVIDVEVDHRHIIDVDLDVSTMEVQTCDLNVIDVEMDASTGDEIIDVESTDVRTTDFDVNYLGVIDVELSDSHMNSDVADSSTSSLVSADMHHVKEASIDMCSADVPPTSGARGLDALPNNTFDLLVDVGRSLSSYSDSAIADLENSSSCRGSFDVRTYLPKERLVCGRGDLSGGRGPVHLRTSASSCTYLAEPVSQSRNRTVADAEASLSDCITLASNGPMDDLCGSRLGDRLMTDLEVSQSRERNAAVHGMTISTNRAQVHPQPQSVSADIGERANIETSLCSDIAQAGLQSSDRAQADLVNLQSSDSALADLGDLQSSDRAQADLVNPQSCDSAQADLENLQSSDSAQADLENLQSSDSAQADLETIQSSDSSQADLEDLQSSDSAQADLVNLQSSDSAQADIENLQSSDGALAELENLQSSDSAQAELENLQFSDGIQADLEFSQCSGTIVTDGMNSTPSATAQADVVNPQYSDSALADLENQQVSEIALADLDNTQSNDTALADLDSTLSCDRTLADLENPQSGDRALADLEGTLPCDSALADLECPQSSDRPFADLDSTLSCDRAQADLVTLPCDKALADLEDTLPCDRALADLDGTLPCDKALADLEGTLPCDRALADLDGRLPCDKALADLEGTLPCHKAMADLVNSTSIGTARVDLECTQPINMSLNYLSTSLSSDSCG